MAIGIIPSVWMGYLPYIAYLVTIVWGSCQIYSWFINKNYKPKKDRNG